MAKLAEYQRYMKYLCEALGAPGSPRRVFGLQPRVDAAD